MIAHVVNWAVDKRWLVLLLTAIAAIVGAASLYRLPIDAVPDNRIDTAARKSRNANKTGLPPQKRSARGRARIMPIALGQGL